MSRSCRTRRISGSTKWGMANELAQPLHSIGLLRTVAFAMRPDRVGLFTSRGMVRTAIHDWGMEFTAAGVLMQSELLLISREQTAILRYLPKLERSVEFIETRRDPTNNLFLAGPAGNLLAPSYAGWKKPDGTYGQAYHAGLSVTYIAALDRLIELEKMVGRTATAGLYTTRRDTAKQALARFTTEEGYLLRSIDPDGVKHGVYGAIKHGYFESSRITTQSLSVWWTTCRRNASYAKLASDSAIAAPRFYRPELSFLRRHV